MTEARERKILLFEKLDRERKYCLLRVRTTPKGRTRSEAQRARQEREQEVARLRRVRGQEVALLRHEREQEIVRLHHAGLSFAEVGHRFEISKQRAHQIIKKASNA